MGELKLAEQDRDNLVALSPDLMCVASFDGYFLMVNPAFELTLGYSRDELLSKPFVDFVHEDDRDATLDALRSLTTGSRAFEFENRYRCADGTYRWLSWAAHPVVTEQKVYAVARDITDRKRAEQARIESDAKFGVLAETVAAATFIFQGTSNRYVNSAAVKMTGYTRDELLRMNFWDVIHPEFRETVRKRGLARQRNEGVPTRDEIKLLRKDGEVRWVEFSAAVIEFGGEQAVLGTAFDITERIHADQALRESEERLRDLFENANDLIQLIDPDGRFVYVNRAWTRALGYTHDEATRLSFNDIIAKDQIDHCQSVFRQLMSGRTIDNMETRFVTKDGREIVVEGNVSTRLTDGKPVHTRGIFRDVTARKQAEEQARGHQAELARVQRVSTMGEMAAALAHEINQPLASILYYTRGCVRRMRAGASSPDELLNVLEKIAEQAERAATIIRRHRAFVRKDAPRLAIADLNDIVREAVAFAEGEARKNGVTLRVRLRETMPPAVVDTIEIEQVIVNLVRNGIDAIASSSCAERVLEIETVFAGADQLEVIVTDTGPGVTDEARAQIFEPYFSTNDKGMGLGLSISWSIINAHSGRLWNVPRANGARFRFSLPVASSADLEAIDVRDDAVESEEFSAEDTPRERRERPRGSNNE